MPTAAMNPTERHRAGGVPTLAALARVALPAIACALASPCAHADGPPTGLVPIANLSAGDSAWMMVSTALVLLMTLPGTALFYAGMVRKKNVLSMLMQSYTIAALVTLVWWAVGYSLALTPGTPYLGGLSRAFFGGLTFDKASGLVSVSPIAPTVPETVVALFELTFAIVTGALICGAFAERMKFSALIVFMTAWSLLVYVPVAHWVWEPGGWLAGRGVLDYAGGTVVHINAGVAGLAGALVMGKRAGYGKFSMAPHNLVLTVIGTGLLWVGWFGFNAGSAGAADARAGLAMLTTQLGAAAAALAWMGMERLTRRKPSVLGLASGAVAGLVAITPASGFVGPNAAVVIGLVAGVVCFYGATSLKHLLGYDDSLDAFGVHGVGGIAGALLTGPLADPAIGGSAGSLGAQALGVGVTVVYGFCVSYALFWLINRTMGLRVTDEEEREGLDVAQHGESIE